MEQFSVTTGEEFTDIDSLACTLAYTELLQMEGKVAEAVLPGILNQSVTPTIKSWKLDFSKIPSNLDSGVVLVDLSDPPNFARFVKEENIVEIYDHHGGFEEYWQEKLGRNAKIEPIGACATLIWEEFVSRGFEEKISPISANLLYTAILSNTLNFNAKITNVRDKKAFEELKPYTDLPDSWKEKYYTELEKNVYANVAETLESDIKIFEIPNQNLRLVISQLELWNGNKFIEKYQKKIKDALEKYDNPFWLFILPSISEGKNYLFCQDQKIKDLMSGTIGAKFNGDIGTTNQLWLRKEIFKKLLH